jgi:hypothetical protein
MKLGSFRKFWVVRNFSRISSDGWVRSAKDAARTLPATLRVPVLARALAWLALSFRWPLMPQNSVLRFVNFGKFRVLHLFRCAT